MCRHNWSSVPGLNNKSICGLLSFCTFIIVDLSFLLHEYSSQLFDFHIKFINLVVNDVSFSLYHSR